MATTVVDPDVVWTGHEDGSLFRTLDSSSAQPLWRAADTLELPDEPVTALAVDPFDGNVAYAAFGRADRGDLWKTHDGGVTWTPLAAGAPAALSSGPTRDIAIDPRGSEFVYAGSAEGLFASRDGGLTWARADDTEGAVSELHWARFGLAVATPNGVFTAATETPATAHPDTLTFTVAPAPDEEADVQWSDPDTVVLTYRGGGSAEWTATADRPWIDVRAAGAPGTFEVRVRVPGRQPLGALDRTGTVTFRASNVSAVLTVPVARTIERSAGRPAGAAR